MSAQDIEARRQQRLLQVLWRQQPAAVLAPELRGDAASIGRGVAVYRNNALAHVRRALADGFPVLRALVGDEDFDAMAAAYWLARPPERGDLAHAGEALAGFIAAQPQLADWPYLADVARLERALQLAALAPEVASPPRGLALLGEHEPSALQIVPAAGVALIESCWPVARIHAAHAPEADESAFEAARAALAACEGDSVLVGRVGPSSALWPLEPAVLRWWRVVMDGGSVEAALQQAGADFDFEGWLVDALMKGWIDSVRPTPVATSTE